MRVLFDVVHPAHVHFFRYLREDLIDDGHEVLVVSRDKDVTLELLDDLSIPHEPAGRATTGGSIRRAIELASRVIALVAHIRRFRPDVVVSRNPAGVQAARLAGVPGVFDTDDGSAAGMHFRLARPFASVITTPSCLGEDFGPKHRRYEGIKALAFLHPDRFTPDPAVRRELDVGPDEHLFVARFSSYTASHDLNARGLPPASRRALIETLDPRGRVVISDEGELPTELHPLRFPLPSDRFHDVLAAADLCVGDSQSVAAEAALLGTPALRLSTFSDRVDYLGMLEERYGLIRNFKPGEEADFLEAVEQAVEELPDLARRTAAGRSRLLAESVDVTAWFYDLLFDLVDDHESGPRQTESAPYQHGAPRTVQDDRRTGGEFRPER